MNKEKFDFNSSTFSSLDTGEINLEVMKEAIQMIEISEKERAMFIDGLQQFFAQNNFTVIKNKHLPKNIIIFGGH